MAFLLRPASLSLSSTTPLIYIPSCSLSVASEALQYGHSLDMLSFPISFSSDSGFHNLETDISPFGEKKICTRLDIWWWQQLDTSNMLQMSASLTTDYRDHDVTEIKVPLSKISSLENLKENNFQQITFPAISPKCRGGDEQFPFLNCPNYNPSSLAQGFILTDPGIISQNDQNSVGDVTTICLFNCLAGRLAPSDGRLQFWKMFNPCFQTRECLQHLPWSVRL